MKEKMKTRLKLKSITRTMLNLLFPLNINTKYTTTTTIYNIYYVYICKYVYECCCCRGGDET